MFRFGSVQFALVQTVVSGVISRKRKKTRKQMIKGKVNEIREVFFFANRAETSFFPSGCSLSPHQIQDPFPPATILRSRGFEKGVGSTQPVRSADICSAALSPPRAPLRKAPVRPLPIRSVGPRAVPPILHRRPVHAGCRRPVRKGQGPFLRQKYVKNTRVDNLL